MKSWTWEEIAKAKAAEKKLIIETHGLLGALAIEVVLSAKGRSNTRVEGCAVFKFLKASLAPGVPAAHFFCTGCPLMKVPCDYSDLGRKNLIKLYAKLYKQMHRKKK